MGIYLDVPSLKLCVNNHFHSMRKNKSIPYFFFFQLVNSASKLNTVL